MSDGAEGAGPEGDGAGGDGPDRRDRADGKGRRDDAGKGNADDDAAADTGAEVQESDAEAAESGDVWPETSTESSADGTANQQAADVLLRAGDREEPPNEDGDAADPTEPPAAGASATERARPSTAPTGDGATSDAGTDAPTAGAEEADPRADADTDADSDAEPEPVAEPEPAADGAADGESVAASERESGTADGSDQDADDGTGDGADDDRAVPAEPAAPPRPSTPPKPAVPPKPGTAPATPATRGTDPAADGSSDASDTPAVDDSSPGTAGQPSAARSAEGAEPSSGAEQSAPPKPTAPPKPPASPPSTEAAPPPEAAGAGSGADAGVPPRPGTAPEQPAGEESSPPAPTVPPRPAGPPPPADSERDPMELLAALTNRQAPPPTPLRTAMRRIKIWTPLVLLLVVLLGVAQLLRPLPEPELTLTASDTFTFDGELPAVPWPETGQAALDVDGVGTFGGVDEDEQVPIASVAKTMTAYVILRDHPMEEHEDGPEIEIDEQAEEDADLGETRGDSVVDVRAGDTLTQREALQALMIASANNVAWLLARWDAGSEEEFVEKMNEAAEELGMDDTVYTDPSGFDLETVSTAADQVKLGRAAMRDPVLRQVVGVSFYTDQYGEDQYNSNILVPENGVVGIKTGSRTDTGGNFLFAARQEVDGEEHLVVGAVLGHPPDPSDNSMRTGAANAGATLMSFGQDQLEQQQVLTEGEVVGHVDNGLGGSTPVVVAEDVAAVGWSGATVDVRLAPDEDGVPDAAAEGTEVGILTIGDSDGEGAVEVPVRLAEGLEEPTFGERVFRLR